MKLDYEISELAKQDLEIFGSITLKNGLQIRQTNLRLGLTLSLLNHYVSCKCRIL